MFLGINSEANFNRCRISEKLVIPGIGTNPYGPMMHGNMWCSRSIVLGYLYKGESGLTTPFNITSWTII